MESKKKNMLVILAYASLAVAILSVFTTIVGYTNLSGTHRTFTIIDFLSSNGNGFDDFVSSEYTGRVLWTVDISVVRVFVVIGTIAFACAIVGLMKISKQKENTASFVLTVLGLVGIMAPSLLMLIVIVIMGGNYKGSVSCGVFPIISPIAMIICITAATQMHRKNKEYKKRLKEAEGMIFRGGDL